MTCSQGIRHAHKGAMGMAVNNGYTPLHACVGGLRLRGSGKGSGSIIPLVKT